MPSSASKPKRAAADPRFRVLPASDIAERGLICSFLLAPKAVGAMAAERQIQPATFHSPALGIIFGVLVDLWDRAQPIDVVVLTQKLHDCQLLEQVGGAAFVSELFTYLPTATNAAHYLEILQEKATLRAIITTGTEFASRGYEEQDNTDGLLDEYEGAVLEIASSRAQAATVPIRTAVMEAVNGLQELYDRRGQISGVPTGFDLLDKMTDGMHAGEMIVIAARPSMGKTALAMNIVEHVAVQVGRPVAVFSLEMGLQQLVQRLLCARARVSLGRVRDGFLSERDFPALTAAASQIAESRLHIDDTAGLKILELRARARRLKAQHDVALIAIDYLQLLHSGSRRGQENRQIEVSEISTGLKELAKELGIPILVLAQLNRKPDDRTGEAKGRPRISDLRESGSIEQDADVVGLLYRDEYYAETDDAKKESEGKATLIIAKQRNGPVGDIPLTFLKEYTRFETRAEEEK